MKRASTAMLTLYHFTAPANLPAILKNGICPHRHDDDDPIVPQQTMAIWLTSNPNGNTITDAAVAYWRGLNQTDLIAEYETGRRHFIFGGNDYGSARLTINLPRKYQGLFNYRELIAEIYRDHPPAVAFIDTMPDISRWWVIICPAIAESFIGIGPGAITEVHPVGEQTPAFVEALAEIQKWRRHDGVESAV
jgi:hypothetical protein